MAHDLNYNEQTKKHSFFSVKEKAWHGLGQILEYHPTSEEAIIFAGLDYEVVKKPIQTLDKEEIENYFATVRTDTAQTLGIVGSKYEVVQNKTAFSFFDALIFHLLS